VSRLPIRLKVTLTFAAMIAVVLSGLGLFIFATLRSDLDRTINDGLAARSSDVTALVAQADNGLGTRASTGLAAGREGFAEVLTPRGAVVDASPRLGGRAILTQAELGRAARSPITIDRRGGTVIEDSRLLAGPVRGADGQSLISVVAAPLDSRDEALRKLGFVLLLGMPVALLLASAVAYFVTALALRPVESMRRQAGAISAGDPGVRLPLPDAQDEIHRLGETLNDMLTRLETSFARERRFVADASHELRTPLAILKTELELALRAGRSVAELRDALASATEETDRLAQLAEDLLVIARSDQGELPVRAQEVHVVDLLTGVQARFSGRAHECGRPLIVHDDDEAGVIVADALRLEQAIGNLVDNALRYGDGPLELSAVRRSGIVELHVRDHGDGFPPEFLASAFERFARADQARGRGGAGLGLAIVAAIARAHGGSAHAANGTGTPRGGDVWIALPDPPQPVA
jgi:two-component system OmpR family sensor kinase